MAFSRKSVFIEGVAVEISWRDRTRNLSELIFTTVRKAIDNGGKGLEGIDSVVLAAQDLVDGRSLFQHGNGPRRGSLSA